MSQQLTVYFDGLCPLCSREIKFYRSKASATKIDWQDITEPGFDPDSHGLDKVKIHQSFHVKTKDGKVIAGVEAFISIVSSNPRAIGSMEQLAMSLERMGLPTFPPTSCGRSVSLNGNRWVLIAKPLLPRQFIA
jgi:predicted DCC family thiol-disulfide oxidoreductase YuxK